MHIKFWFENLMGRGYSEDLEVDGRIISKWTLNKYDVRMWTGFNCLGIAKMADVLEHSNEASGSINTGSFLTA
jgi:hypothetical protein